MKGNIPFLEFYNYYKNDMALTSTEEEFKEKINNRTKWLNNMTGVTWEDLESLTPAEMIQIPACWVYDWTHVNCRFDLQDKVEGLYKRYNLPVYSVREYLGAFKKSNKK